MFVLCNSLCRVRLSVAAVRCLLLLFAVCCLLDVVV